MHQPFSFRLRLLRFLVLFVLAAGLSAGLTLSGPPRFQAQAQYIPDYIDTFDNPYANQWRYDYRCSGSPWRVSESALYGRGQCGALWANLSWVTGSLYFLMQPDSYGRSLEVWTNFSPQGYYRVEFTWPDTGTVIVRIFRVSPPDGDPVELSEGTLYGSWEWAIPAKIKLGPGYVRASLAYAPTESSSGEYTVSSEAVVGEDYNSLPAGMAVFMGGVDWSGWIDNLEVFTLSPATPGDWTIQGFVYAENAAGRFPMQKHGITAYGSGDPEIPRLANLGPAYTGEDGSFSIEVQDG
jgi:hypothetical protein